MALEPHCGDRYVVTTVFGLALVTAAKLTKLGFSFTEQAQAKSSFQMAIYSFQHPAVAIHSSVSVKW